MKRDFEASLQTIHSDEPSRMCRRMLEVLSDRLGAPRVWFAQVAEVDGELWYTNVQVDQSKLSQKAATACNERPMFECPWHPEEPNPAHVNRFVDVGREYDRDELDSTEAQRRLFLDNGLSDPARVLVYDGDRFAGWLGLIRDGIGRAFNAEEIDLLNSVRETVRAVICGLEAVRANDAGEAALYAVFTPSGHLEFATDAARQWLHDDRLGHIAPWIRRFDAGRSPSHRSLEGAELRLVRLDDEDGVRYLLTVDRARLPLLDPLQTLTDRQREVAEYAAAGATNGEIADTLDISKSTVKFHLDRIYRRLQIDGRAELAQLR